MNKQALILRGGVAIFLGVVILVLNFFVFNDKEDIDKIQIIVNEKTLQVTLEDNKASKKLREKLTETDLTITMNDYDNMAKIGNLDVTLPTSDQETTTKVGDLILYQGNQLVLYYDTNTESMTKLGHIDIEKDELINILGNSDITLVLHLEK